MKFFSKKNFDISEESDEDIETSQIEINTSQSKLGEKKKSNFKTKMHSFFKKGDTQDPMDKLKELGNKTERGIVSRFMYLLYMIKKRIMV